MISENSGGLDVSWLRHLSLLTEITIIIDPRRWRTYPNLFPHFPTPPPPKQFIPVLPGTLRAESRENILRWTQKCLEHFHSEYPEQAVPELHIMFSYLSEEDDHSSSEDRRFLETLDSHSRHC
jgi:hypothetical protein